MAEATGRSRIAVRPVKLTKTQKKIMSEYLAQKKSIRETAHRLGATETRVYTMLNAMVRHAATHGEFDAEKFLSKF